MKGLRKKKHKKKIPKKFRRGVSSSVYPATVPVSQEVVEEASFRSKASWSTIRSFLTNQTRRGVHFITSYLLLFTAILSIGSAVFIFIIFREEQERIKNRTRPIADTIQIVHPYPSWDNSLGLSVPAFSYIVFEKNSRVTVASKNSELRLLPASTAKIMTALVALEQYSLADILTAHDLYRVPGSKMGLTEGEKMKVDNLLYGLLLPSGNDAAYVLAQSYPGGVSGFVAKMNEKARVLHLENTNFIDPAGYEDGNIASASDLARLGAAAVESQVLRKIVTTPRATVYDVSLSQSHTLSNLNQLLEISGVIGIKTGFTDEAGGVLVTAYTSEGGTYILVVMRSTDRFADTRVLLDTIVKRTGLIAY